MVMHRQPVPFYEVFERIASATNVQEDDDPTPLLIASGWITTAMLCRTTRVKLLPRACEKLLCWSMMQVDVDAQCRADADRFLLQCDQRRERIVLEGGPVTGTGTFVKMIATASLRQVDDSMRVILRECRNNCRLAAGALMRAVVDDAGPTDVPAPSVGARRLALSVCNMVLAEAAAAADDGIHVSALETSCTRIHSTIVNILGDNNHDSV
jgi:hypothetical protein